MTDAAGQQKAKDAEGKQNDINNQADIEAQRTAQNQKDAELGTKEPVAGSPTGQERRGQRVVSARTRPRVVGVPGGSATSVTGRHGFVEEEKTSLPDARVGDKYIGQIEVYSELPYEVRLASGKPPEGLSMDDKGTITGTPKRAGTYKFRVGVVNEDHDDHHHESQSMGFTLVVQPA